MNAQDGGPAFPKPTILVPAQGAFTSIPKDNDKGMSLRDWFAGMALQGYVSGRMTSGNVLSDSMLEYTALCMYEIADAMLAARKEDA